MASPSVPTLANLFLCHHETKWLKQLQSLQISKRYVDDIIALFDKPEQVLPFVNYLNKKRESIKFLFEKGNSFSFLNFKICRENDKFTTSVLTNFSSVISLKFELVLIYTLLHRRFAVVSDFSKFHFEVEILKKETLQKCLLNEICWEVYFEVS